MNFPELFFYLFASVTIGFALIVAFSPNLLHSAFTLFFLLFCMAGFYALLGGDFLAMVQLMVYAGGINVLLIFGTMLTADVIQPERSNLSFQGILTFFSGVAFTSVLLAVFDRTEWPLLEQPVKISPTTLDIGKLLLKEYVLPFEVISFLLVAAMVGAVMVVMGGKEE